MPTGVTRQSSYLRGQLTGSTSKSAFIFGNAVTKATLSGKTVVAVAGTPVKLGNDGVLVQGGITIKAMSTNTGLIYIGDTGYETVNSHTGFQLSAKEQIYLSWLDHLGQIWLDAAVNGEGVVWIKNDAG